MQALIYGGCKETYNFHGKLSRNRFIFGDLYSVILYKGPQKNGSCIHETDKWELNKLIIVSVPCL